MYRYARHKRHAYSFARREFITLFPKAMSTFSPRYKPVVLCGSYWAVFLCLVAGMALDMGQCGTLYLYSLAAYVSLVLMVLLRRPSSPTATDLLAVKWGLPALFAFSMAFCPLVWHWRGVRW